MKARASRAVPIYIFSASSFFRAKWHKFCYKPAPFKSRRREKCFDLGTNRHRKKSLVRTVQTFPLATRSTRLPRAYLLYSLIYTLSALPILSVLLSSHFSAPSPRRHPSPRRPFSTPTLALPSPPSLHPPHPCVSSSKEKTERFVREQPFKTVTCALQTARKSLCNPPQKQKNADFLKFFESKSCLVQKVAVLLHSLTEKTGVPVSSERQQKFFEKIP